MCDIRLRVLCITMFFSALATGTLSQSRRVLRLMTWNVENLFDTIHDEGFRDEEFLPSGERRWTPHRYWQKLDDVARTVVSVAGDGAVPDLVGLCEVENDSVLTMLTRRSSLRHLDYDYAMTHSADARGIDVALLYQPHRFRLLHVSAVVVPSREHGLRPTRDILHATGLVATESGGVDTLHVVVVHLPSRAGGHEGDKNRRFASTALWTLTDSLLTANSNANVVVMGDFNASSRDRIFRRCRLRLTDDRQSAGTYCFRGYWQWIDHILLSPHVVTDAPARPLALPWLLEENKTYGGDMPRRTYRGPVYHGGVSDHLPVVLDVRLTN